MAAHSVLMERARRWPNAPIRRHASHACVLPGRYVSVVPRIEPNTPIGELSKAALVRPPLFSRASLWQAAWKDSCEVVRLAVVVAHPDWRNVAVRGINGVAAEQQPAGPRARRTDELQRSPSARLDPLVYPQRRTAADRRDGGEARAVVSAHRLNPSRLAATA
eukprot:COSAG02_NODE_25400_length_660_cov_0.606061_1_plen_162_part_10